MCLSFPDARLKYLHSSHVNSGGSGFKLVAVYSHIKERKIRIRSTQIHFEKSLKSPCSTARFFQLGNLDFFRIIHHIEVSFSFVTG